MSDKYENETQTSPSSSAISSTSQGQRPGPGSGGDVLSLQTSSSPSLGWPNDDDADIEHEERDSNEEAEDFPRGDFFGQDEEDVVVLAPNHPLLSNFHKAIFKHLSRQKEQLAIDIKEMASKVKVKRRESDDVAEKLYLVQQSVSRQHAQLDIKTENAASSAELRDELEKCNKEFTGNHREVAKNLQEAQIMEQNLWHSLGEKTLKDNLIRRKEEEAEAQLALVRRQTEKAKIDKRNLIEEKKKQDEFVYRLTCQVSDLQALLAKLEHQTASKQNEEAKLQQAVKMAGVDLEELSRDQHRLSQVWQRLLVAAKNKDSEFTFLLEKTESIREGIKLAEKLNEQYVKGWEVEKKHNEKCMAAYKRIQREKARLDVQIRKEIKRVEELQEQMDKTSALVGMTEDNVKEINRVLRSKESRLKILEHEILNLRSSEMELEKKLLEAMNAQATQDKSVQLTIKRVDELNNILDGQEKEKAQKEMQFAQVELEMQKLKHEEAQIIEYQKQQVEKANEGNWEVQVAEQELRKAQTELSVKQGRFDRLNSKLAAHVEKTGGQEMNPAEARITEMENEIKALSAEIQRLQKSLLRKEVALMDRNEKMSKLRKEAEILQRSLENLQHKSRGQVEELERLNALKSSVKKSLENQALALSNVDKEIAKTKMEQLELQKDNLLSITGIQSVVKEEELKMHELSGKLLLLSTERNQLYDTLRQLQTEQVDLEGKLSLASETKLAIERERGCQGEISAMKTEIHRMEVRLSQLKRAQEKLKLDLEQCVLRRDAMVDSNRVRHPKHSVANSARLKALRRYETLKYNNGQLKSKLDKYESDKVSLKVIEREINGLEEELEEKNNQIYKIAEPLKATGSRLHSLRSIKKEKLEQLVHEQKVARGLGDARDGKYKTLCKSESSLIAETEKQKVVHSNLISIVESLEPDFPQHKSHLHSIMATLKSIKVNYQTLSAAPSVQETDEASYVQ
ncbi:coiled-coil domain-containing protein 40-like [Neocloeon triangulifer]|uniref:coiled-coil domain-containing protein 40-like n=1 Tax=Neocloeon triangulifer TaxID=2078957 RepID=UPI00286F4D65|nr:coiled-coil domain-containing protein 40-like [Neocloeon triangulifer]